MTIKFSWPLGILSEEYKNIYYMLIATFFFTLMNLCVKTLHRLPVHELVFFRGGIALLLSIYFIRKKGLYFWGNK